MGAEKYVGTDEFLDIKELSELRSNHEYEKVYTIAKEKYHQFPNNDFLMAQYLISTIEFNPKLIDEIKEISDILFETKVKKNIAYANMGYAIYYLGVDDVDKAYEYFKKVYDKPFHRRRIIQTISSFKCSKRFRKKIFDVDLAIEEIKNPDLHDDRYIYKTYDIGEVFIERRDYKKALYYFQLSLERRLTSIYFKNKINKQPLCYAKIGKCYFHLYDFDNFDFNYKKALEISKKVSIDLYYKILYEYILSLNDFNKTEEATKLTYELDKGSPKDQCLAIFARGKILKNLGETENAIKVFESLLSKNSSDHQYDYIELIKSYVCLDMYDKAEEYVNKLYSDYPTTSPLTRVAFLHDIMKNEEAIEEAKKLLDTEYDADARYFIGRSLNRLRRYEEAEPYLEECKKTVNKSTLFFELGLVQEKTGNFDKAYEYYNEYVERVLSRGDKPRIKKGLTAMIGLLITIYEFNSANYYVHLYEEYFESDCIEDVYDIKAQFYFRKQEFDKAIYYYNELLGTSFDAEARSMLAVIYRYTGQVDKIPSILEGLEGTTYKEQSKLSLAKGLKDKHTKESLEEAYKVLSSIESDAEFKNLANVEKVQILIKLKQYESADQELEKARSEFAINAKEYYRFKGYLSIKLGTFDSEEPKYKNIFLTYAQSYNQKIASRNVQLMSDSNKGAKQFLYTNDELSDLYDDIYHSLNLYDYYVSDLFDVYVIDMGEVIGNFFGIETRYLEVKCEINTYNIHIMQPTLKTINVNKYLGNVRRRKTDCSEN